MWPRHRLDITPRDLVAALCACMSLRCQPAVEQSVAHDWCADPAVATLSVRSAFDLLLSACDFPDGAEVVMSSVTVPDMERIALSHGLRVRAIDIDEATLVPLAERLREVVSSDTAMVVIAQLFGGASSLAAHATIAHEHGALLVEDCAQALHDPTHTGDTAADVSLFSFGMIKTATALGGGLARVNNQALRERMCQVQATWPAQKRRAYFVRVLRAAALVAMSRRRTYGLLRNAVLRTGRDFDTWISRMTRGFGDVPVDELLVRIRRRPSVPQLLTIRRRLRGLSAARIKRRAHMGEALRRQLPAHSMPGRAQDLRTHWVTPVVSRMPKTIVNELVTAGFDASAGGTTSIVAIGGPATPVAHRIVQSSVFVPGYPELDDSEAARLASLIAASPALQQKKAPSRDEALSPTV